MCYRVKPANSQPKFVKVPMIFVNNHIGPEKIGTLKDDELCLPSLKGAA